MGPELAVRRVAHAAQHAAAGGAALLLLLSAACRTTEPSPVVPALELRMADPVIAEFVIATGIFVAEFPVTVSDPDGPGGSLAFVETTVVNRSRGTVVVTNQRPNATHVYPNTTVPRGGSLTVEAGVGFNPTPPRDEIGITVRVTLTDGRTVARTSALHQQF